MYKYSTDKTISDRCLIPVYNVNYTIFLLMFRNLKLQPVITYNSYYLLTIIIYHIVYTKEK